MTREEMQAQIDALKAENANLKEKRRVKPTLKVSQKGGVSLYGLGRFPVTLYKTQWDTVCGMTEEIKKFIADHESELKVKE